MLPHFVFGHNHHFFFLFAEGVKQEHVDINDLAINAFASKRLVDSFMDFIEVYKTKHDSSRSEERR